MRQIDIEDAKSHLSRLVEEAAAGDPFLIAKAGRPVAMVVPVQAPKAKSRLGFLAGQFSIPDDFDRIGDEAIAPTFEWGA